jgi:hypothetical protein
MISASSWLTIQLSGNWRELATKPRFHNFLGERVFLRGLYADRSRVVSSQTASTTPMTIATATDGRANPSDRREWLPTLAKHALARVRRSIKRHRAARARDELHTHTQQVTQLARVALTEVLTQHFGFEQARSERARVACVQRAENAAEYLFGKPQRELEKDARMVAREHAVARKWLEHNDRMRDLVLQSLLVLNADAGKGQMIGEALLKAYGLADKRALALPDYHRLVRQLIDELPAQLQQSIYYRWAMSQMHR